jgi:hypothetical protein
LLLDPGLYEAWRNYGSGFATAAFYKDQLGIVHLRGLVAISSSTSSLFFQSNNPAFAAFFRLPAGYRPSNVRVFPSEGRGGGQLDVAASRIDVQPDGLVVLEQDCSSDFESCSADGEYVTLEGISFRPDE